jgi:hypothetical protein
VDRAAAIHPHAPPLTRLQPPRRQRPQQRHFLRQPPAPVGVELPEQLPQERLVRRSAGEVPAATQQQRLLQRPLELAMTLLDVTVLVGTTRLDRLPLQAIVPQQSLVTVGERGPPGPWRHGGRQPIGAVQPRHSPQFPQGILQPVAEALVALGEADRPRLPVRVRQHEVVDQVIERRTLDRHVQVGAVGKIAGRQPAGVMHLGEEHLLGRPLHGPPLLDVPLQGAQLSIGEAARETPLQVGEQRFGLQTGVEGQLVSELGPDVGERVGPGTPVAIHAFDLTGQLTQAAVLACRLGVDAGFGGRQLLGDAVTVEAEELAYLRIGDHRQPPVMGLPMVYSCWPTGNSSCR